MQPIFNDDDLMVKLNVIHKLRKALQREGKGYHIRACCIVASVWV